ncbi:hypothetical protein MJG53_015671 [Ovis ammon polii x Ovis aries]|uniref:Uncharacterized protein n=2 Tax=Ovis TaxID=9935 RepID=A0AAD4TU17_OVIAM|nr:hypothetical protein MG293_016952 [Ovis ammon polii]KAI4556719.1 hypothetical protein MJT46_015342 [Ovis ammon polii x Ovis aries]KAI4566994.1 hypothetical protein MJG53_015671 [Ovis ammon polii x Ovis aries]
MDLQRLDSYQGGAGPDFHEHVLHKMVYTGEGPPPEVQIVRGFIHSFKSLGSLSHILSPDSQPCDPQEPLHSIILVEGYIVLPPLPPKLQTH